MASKQLGKFKQWAEEVILSNKDKSTVTDEFASLETDVELRKAGLLRLNTASETYYYHVLMKKKESEPAETLLTGAVATASGDVKESVRTAVTKTPLVKQMPIETLGLIMSAHGEQFGEDSAFGSSLSRMGKAHVEMAKIQAEFADNFRTQWLASCHRFGDDIRDFEHQKKKLESRRLSYSAAIAKHDRSVANKKERDKDRKEAEEELQTARLRYEETSEDVRSRARLIQDNEIQQLRSLTELLNLEIKYAEQNLSILQECKAGWYDEFVIYYESQCYLDSLPRSLLERVPIPRSNGPAHKFSRSVESNKAKLNAIDAKDSSEDDEPTKAVPAPSLSRATSRSSRKRKDSAGAVSTLSVGERDRNKEKERAEREKTAMAGGRSMGVGDITGWASNAVNSVAGMITATTAGTPKSRADLDQFAALSEDEASGMNSRRGVETIKAKRPSRPVSMHGRSTSSFSVSRAAGAVTGLFAPSTSIPTASFRAQDRSRSKSPPLKAPQSASSYVTTYTSDPDDEGGLFGDHNIISHRSPMSGYFDHGGVDSIGESDDDRVNDAGIQSSLGGLSRAASSTKRPVPPPPPPRRASRAEPLQSPPLPARRSRTESAGAKSIIAPAYSAEHEVSPFDSSADLDAPAMTVGCGSFRQNPFLPKGMCSNCQQYHT